MTPAARSVVLSALPEATERDSALQPNPQRPRNGWSDKEWNERSKYAGTRRPSSDWLRPYAPIHSPRFPEGSEFAAETPGAINNLQGLGQSGLTPPDMGLAVGPTYIVQMVNARITVMTKTGVVQAGFPKTLNAFLGLPANARTFDPRVIFDWVKGRYVAVVDQADFANSRGFLWIAISQTNNPTGGWFLYQLQMGGAGTCPDFPTLGQDRDGIYVAANKFACDPGGFGGFQDAEVWLIPKANAYTGGAFGFWFQFGFNVGGVMLDTMQPVNVQNKMDNPRAEFMVNSFNINFGGGQCLNGCSGLILWAISNQFGFLTGGPAPRFSAITLPTATYWLSLGVHQPGDDYSIDGGDTRISGSVNYSAGRIFTSVTTAVLGTGPPEQSSTFWWEIGQIILNDGDPACVGAFLNRCALLTSAAVLQQDCFVCGGWANNGSAYYGALQPDPEGNVTMVYNFSSSVNFAGTAYVSRRVTQALNTMHDPGIWLRAGQAFYNQVRFGDYTATAIDLTQVNQPFMWFSGMFVLPNGNWGTRIGKNGFRFPNEP